MDKQYSLVIFDADGTLTPLRDGATGAFAFTLLPGVAEKCAALRADDVIMCIASNQSARRPVREVIEQLEWTKRQIGARHYDVQTNQNYQKPHPDMILGDVDWFGARFEDVLFVGDRETDRQAAEAAGVDFAWAADFFGWEAINA